MTESASPLVSVVTPVYNGEQFLDECIQCVLAQTYPHWEYIILNNCSTDGTLKIAEKYAAQDQRIRIFSNPALLPIMENWNRALGYMAPDSKYCKVVHADDLLLPECLSRMVSMAETCPAAGLVGSYCLWGNRVVADGLPYTETFFPGKEIGRLTLLDKIYCFWSPSNLLIRSNLIRKRNCFYNEDILHADIEVLYEILQASDFAFVHQVLTVIRIHDDSVTNKIAAPYNKIMLSNLDLLHRYGPIYLSRNEFKAHLKKKINTYYGFLVRSFFQLREKDFWRFQFHASKRMGYQIKITIFLYKLIGAMVASPLANLVEMANAFKVKMSNKL